MIFKSNRQNYTLYGALFGLSFPILSIIIILFISNDIRILLAVICTAPLFLGIFSRLAGVRQDKVNEINKGLEKTIEERTRAIQNMLDVSGQGFLSFGPDLKIKGNYSKICEIILNQKIPGKKIHELLFYKDDEKKNDFSDGFSLFFSGRTKGEVIFDLMEKEIDYGEKTLRVEYRTISDKEVLCIITDITTEKTLQDKLRKDDENKNIILQVISHQKYFSSFVSEANNLFDFMNAVGSSKTTDDFETLQRDLHTFKGNASFFSFNNTKDTAHELEFYISDCLVLEEDINLEQQSVVLKKAYFNEINVIQETLGEHWIYDIDNITIPQNNYLKLEEYIDKKYREDNQLKTAIKHFRKVPFSEMFARFPDMTNRLATSLGKRIDPIEINGGRMPILPEYYQGLINSFVHLVRNMLDHGIESPSEREFKNKPSEGKIRIDIEESDKGIEIIFSDDGKGISLTAIEQKAVEKGMIEKKQKYKPGDLIKLIFSHNFSTADAITEVSGRGAGLSAVKAEVDKLKGRISVTTKQNQGTTFRITVPEIK